MAGPPGERHIVSDDIIAITSRTLGALEVPAAEIIRATTPIPPFPAASRYALIGHVNDDGATDTLVHWLQALDEPFHAFVMIDPWHVDGDYAPEISDADAAELELSSPAQARLYAMARVDSSGEVPQMTINLRAPVVINIERGLLKQVVLISDRYSVQHPVLSPQASAAPAPAEAPAPAS